MLLSQWNERERDKGNAKGEKTRGLAGELHFASNEVKFVAGGRDIRAYVRVQQDEALEPRNGRDIA